MKRAPLPERKATQEPKNKRVLMEKKKIPTAAELEKGIRELMASHLSHEELRTRLEELAGHRSFAGFTWLWGPLLYERNRVLFRPFILSHFSSFLVNETFTWKWVEWRSDKAAALDKWLDEVDRYDDVELFRRLYAWKTAKGRFHQIDNTKVHIDLCNRFEEAGSPARRATVLDKFELWFTLDEPSAQKLYAVDGRAAKPFIIRHLPLAWWSQNKRNLWKSLYDLAIEKDDGEMAFALYRKQIPLPAWRSEILQLCDSVRDSEELNEELAKRHPEGYGIEYGEIFYHLVMKRGRDVLPYVVKNLRRAWFRRGLLKTGYEKLAELSYQREWLDLWSALTRIVLPQKDYNNAISKLLDDNRLSLEQKTQRLLLLCGASREWNFPGLGFMQVQQLDDEVAVKLYEKLPHLLRGPFKANISVTWGRPYKKLLEKAIAVKDEVIIDYLAARLATRWGVSADEQLKSIIDSLSSYYEAFRSDTPVFSRRASDVLSQIPAFAIYNYDAIIKDNRLARLLFERSFSSYLDDAVAVRNLLEAPEIHVQTMIYRALGLRDERAARLAAANLDILMGTLLRPLHRRTRMAAFDALENAISTTAEAAARVCSRAREAFELPEVRYPKERLLGLVGSILRRWPELREEGEEPLVYSEACREGRP